MSCFEGKFDALHGLRLGGVGNGFHIVPVLRKSAREDATDVNSLGSGFEPAFRPEHGLVYDTRGFVGRLGSDIRIASFVSLRYAAQRKQYLGPFYS